MSVLTQDVSNLRLLIIDNASTDGSQDIAREIAASDSRVELILNDVNMGMHHSSNRAIDWASAEYFILLDADDMLAEGALAEGLPFLDENPDVAFLYGVEGRLTDGLLDPGRCDARKTRRKVVSGMDYIRQTCKDSFCDVGAPAVIVRTAAQKKAGHYRESLTRTFDFEMYLRLAMHGGVASTNRVTGIRRLHQRQVSTPFLENPLLDFEEHERAFETFFAHEGATLPNAAELHAMSRRKMGDYVYWYAMQQKLRRSTDVRTSLEFAAIRRAHPAWAPPLPFLFKKRWLRSAWRSARRVIHEPVPPTPSFGVPQYL